MAQIKYDQAGNAWDVSSGIPVLVRQAPPASIVTKAPNALDVQGKILGNTRTQQEITQAEATAAANTAKANAEAQSAKIKAETDAEQWAINHPSSNGTATLSGPAYMQYLQKTNPGRAAYIQGLAEGRVPFPGAQMMRSAAGQALLADVMRADPTIDATNYTTRAAARKNAATGQLSQSDNNLITAIGHAARLNTLVPDVFGSKVTPFNAIANGIDSSLFGGKQPEYDQNARLLGSEIGGAYGQGTGSERGKDASDFSSSLTTKQKLDNINGAIDLMASKLAANRAQFSYGNGQLGKPDFMLLPAQTREQLLSIPGGDQIAAKYFVGIPSMAGGGGLGGGGSAPPPVRPMGGPQTPGGAPVADYSGMTGGPGANLATMDPNSKLGVFQPTYRTVFDPVGAGALAAMIRKGSSYDKAAAYATSHGYNPPDPKAYAAAVAFAQNHNGAVNVEANRTVPTTIGERLSSSPAAAALAGAASGATAGLDDVAGRSVLGDQWDANTAALAATHPTANLIGNIAGGTGAMIGGGSLAQALLRAGAKGGAARNLLAWGLANPVKSAAIGDAAYGTTYGAAENPDNPLQGAGIGAIAAPLASLGGSAATKVLGGAVRGVVNPAVDRLSAAGIPLTAGEVLGGGFKKAQDAATSVFGPGNMVTARYADGRRAFNQAAFNQAGQVVGAPINAVGDEAINKLTAAKTNAYANALNPVSLDLNTPQAVQDIGSALKTGLAIPNVDQARDIATNSIGNYVGNAAPGGIMSGTDFQQAYRGLSRTANKSSDRIYGHEIGQSLGQAQDALVNALQAQNPGAYEGFLAANKANRMLNILATAKNSAQNQVGDTGEQLFTPAQLGSAATANTRNFNGNIAAAGGYRPFDQLAKDGQQVMSSKLPDSGTATRALVTKLAMTGSLLGGSSALGYGVGGNEGAEGAGLGTLAAGSLFGTKLGQQLLVAALIKRNTAMRRGGQALIDNPGYLAAASTAAQVPYFTTPQ